MTKVMSESEHAQILRLLKRCEEAFEGITGMVRDDPDHAEYLAQSAWHDAHKARKLLKRLRSSS